MSSKFAEYLKEVLRIGVPGLKMEAPSFISSFDETPHVRLLTAAKFGKINAFKAALFDGAVIDQPVFVSACQSGKPELVQLCLSKQLPVGPEHILAATYAVLGLNCKNLGFLDDVRQTVKDRDRLQAFQSLKLLIDAGGPVNGGKPILDEAAYLILNRSNICPHLFIYPPLLDAAIQGDAELCALLMLSGADPERSSRHGISAEKNARGSASALMAARRIFDNKPNDIPIPKTKKAKP